MCVWRCLLSWVSSFPHRPEAPCLFQTPLRHSIPPFTPLSGMQLHNTRARARVRPTPKPTAALSPHTPCPPEPSAAAAACPPLSAAHRFTRAAPGTATAAADESPVTRGSSEALRTQDPKHLSTPSTAMQEREGLLAASASLGSSSSPQHAGVGLSGTTKAGPRGHGGSKGGVSAFGRLLRAGGAGLAAAKGSLHELSGGQAEGVRRSVAGGVAGPVQLQAHNVRSHLPIRSRSLHAGSGRRADPSMSMSLPTPVTTHRRVHALAHQLVHQRRPGSATVSARRSPGARTNCTAPCVAAHRSRHRSAQLPSSGCRRVTGTAPASDLLQRSRPGSATAGTVTPLYYRP